MNKTVVYKTMQKKPTSRDKQTNFANKLYEHKPWTIHISFRCLAQS